MRKMKESGVEWIGEIPENWEVTRFKKICSIHTGNSIKDEDKALYNDMYKAHPYISSKDIDGTFLVANYLNGVYIKNNDTSFKVAPVNSTLMCIEGGSAGKKKFSVQKEVSFVNKLCCFYSNTNNNKYIYYYLCSPNYEKEFQNNITGLIGGVSVSVLKNFSLPIPPLETQERIADYLDQKCGKIDAILAGEQRAIDKLKEYKLSLITEKVTKGLDPTVPMKDSGVEWIGEIPEGWEVSKLRNKITLKQNLVNPEKYSSLPQISPENIDKNSGKLLSNYGSVKDSGVISSNHLFYKGQILYSKIRPILNKVIIAPFDGLCSADMYPIETNNNTNFVVYLMLSNYFTFQVGMVTCNRVKMPKINKAELSDLLVTLPPLEEQKTIADYLDQKCAKIDTAIESKEKLIEKLTEYKKSLIYEVVTGKKEV